MIKSIPPNTEITNEEERFNRATHWIVPGGFYYHSIRVEKSRDVFYNGLEQEMILIERRRTLKNLVDGCPFWERKQKTAAGKWLEEMAQIDAYFERKLLEDVA